MGTAEIASKNSQVRKNFGSRFRDSMSFLIAYKNASDLDQERGAMGAAEIASKFLQTRKMAGRTFETP